MITKELIEKVLPPKLKSSATQSLVDMINNVTQDQVLAEQIRDNFVSYTSVLKEGRFNTSDYLNAVVYVSYKLMNHTNQDAYIKTFPKRYQDMMARGCSPKDITAYVAAYAKGKLVNLVMEQSLVPSWVLNQDAYQKAINTQVDLMTNAASELVRTQAANSILTHLAKPKEAGPLINIDLRENSGVNEMRDLMREMAQQQQDLIANGVTPKEIAAMKIIPGEVIDDVN